MYPCRVVSVGMKTFEILGSCSTAKQSIEQRESKSYLHLYVSFDSLLPFIRRIRTCYDSWSFPCDFWFHISESHPQIYAVEQSQCGSGNMSFLNNTQKCGLNWGKFASLSNSAPHTELTAVGVTVSLFGELTGGKEWYSSIFRGLNSGVLLSCDLALGLPSPPKPSQQLAELACCTLRVHSSWQKALHTTFVSH